MKLEGKKAIVTGAAKGIGAAIALAFAEEGADVVISYRTNEGSANEIAKIISDKGRAASAIKADFEQKDQIEQFYHKALEKLGKVDILVNNAAGYDTSAFLDLSPDRFDALLKVGIIAPMILIQLAAKQMIQNQIEGKIINISSISGNRPYVNRTAFCTAKAGLNMLTESTALELAPHKIRVNAISPGATLDFPSTQKTIPLQRTGLPEDHARAALYLASDDSSWVTGQILTVDGGQSLSF